MDEINVNEVLESKKCSRDRYWSEIEDDVKIHRLRMEVKALQRKVKEQAIFIKKLLIHSHLGNELVTILQTDDEPKIEGWRFNITQGDDVYF